MKNKKKRNNLLILLLFSTILTLISARQSVAVPILNLDIIGGADFYVNQSIPIDENIIKIPPGDADALVIRATISNTGDETFVGLPDSTYFTVNTGDPILMYGSTGVENGSFVTEGNGLDYLPAIHPFIGGFSLAPGGSIDFILHVIQGLFCNSCNNLGGPSLVPAPIGTQMNIIENYMWLRQAEIIDGLVVDDPDEPPNILLYANAPYPLTVTVVSSSEPVPEPATILLFGTGIVGLAGSRLRIKKK